MKYGISSALAAMLLSTSAMSADVVTIADAPAQAGVSVYDWSGFHIGVGGGRGAVVHEVTVPAFPGINFNGIGGEGQFGQVTVGYDYMFSNGVVLGAMVSGRYGNIETTFDIPGVFNLDVTAEYGFDVVGRVGYAVTPSTLAYVLGGYTWQRFETSSSVPGLNYNFDEGGYVVGLGMESVIRGNWTLRGEYRYSDFGNHGGGILGFGVLNVDPSMHTFHTTLNYRFGGGPSGQTVAPMVHDWSGLKVGGAVGGGALIHDIDVFGGGASFNGVGAEGFLGEINVGYDFEVGNRFVVGVVGAARLSNISTDLTLGPFGTFSVEADHGYDALLRAGLKIGDRALGYVIGGYTYQNFEFSAPGGFTFDWDQDGYTIGSGMEVAFSERVTGYAEYRYSSYSKEDFTSVGFPPGLLDTNPSSHTVRVGAKVKLF